MYSKIIVLSFPQEVARKALIYHLAKNYNISFNILRADISNKKEGFLVLEIESESRRVFNQAIEFLKNQGINISTPEHQIFKDETICTHCGACIAVCPTEALYIRRPEMEVIFDRTKCSVCELCIPACPSRAMGLFSKHTKEMT